MKLPFIVFACVSFFVTAVTPLILFAVVLSFELSGSDIPDAFDAFPTRPLSLFLWVYQTVFFIIVCAWGWKLRDNQPFKSRNCFLLLLSSAAGFVLRTWLFFAGLVGSGHTRCAANRWIFILTHAGITLPYLLRAIRLHLIFRWTRDRPVSNPQSASRTPRPSSPRRVEPGRRSEANVHSDSSQPFSPASRWMSGSVPGSAANRVLHREQHIEGPLAPPSSLNQPSLLDRRPVPLNTQQLVVQEALSKNPTMFSPATIRHLSELEISSTPSEQHEPPLRGFSPSSSYFETDSPRKPAATWRTPRAASKHSDSDLSFLSTPLLKTDAVSSEPPSLSLTSRPQASYSDRRLFHWFLLCMVPFVFWALFEQLFDLLVTPSTFGCAADEIGVTVGTLLGTGAFYGVEAVLLLATVFIVWNVWDEFNIRTEMMMVFAVDFCLALTWIVSLVLLRGVDNPDKVDGVINSAEYVIITRVSLFFFVSMVWPLYVASSDSNAPLLFPRPGVEVLTMEGALKQAESYEAFCRFMFSENAPALVSFYAEVELFRDMRDAAEVEDTAFRIYDDYIYQALLVLQQEGCDESVGPSLVVHCLSDDTFRTLRRDLESGLKFPALLTIFDAAQREVTEAMRKWYLSKFLVSPFYSQYKRLLSHKESVHQVLLRSNMITS